VSFSVVAHGPATLDGWDISYYAEKQRLALYDFDEEQLRPYFPTERVVSGMFEIVEGIKGASLANAQAIDKKEQNRKLSRH